MSKGYSFLFICSQRGTLSGNIGFQGGLQSLGVFCQKSVNPIRIGWRPNPPCGPPLNLNEKGWGGTHQPRCSGRACSSLTDSCARSVPRGCYESSWSLGVDPSPSPVVARPLPRLQPRAAAIRANECANECTIAYASMRIKEYPIQIPLGPGISGPTQHCGQELVAAPKRILHQVPFNTV